MLAGGGLRSVPATGLDAEVAPTPQIFEAVRERDVDLLILEEFYSSREFRLWWLERMHYPSALTHSVVNVQHSLSVPGAGESDLVLRVTSEEHDVFAMLVEVKIDAPPQHDQAIRYCRRGQAGVPKEWKSFTTCIAARENYLKVYRAETELYMRQITLEEIKGWFEARSQGGVDARSQFKARLLDEAITKTSRSTVVLPVPAVTAFWEVYAGMASAVFRLQIGAGPKGDRSIRIVFHGQKPGQTLVHHLTRGYVDLQLRGKSEQVDKLRDANAALLDGIEVTPAGKSAAFRISVPILHHTRDAVPQETAIRKALNSAERLQDLGSKLRLNGPDTTSP